MAAASGLWRPAADAVEDLQSLLLAHADALARWRAQAAARADCPALACLGDPHPWQHLQLAAQAGLSAIMRHRFPGLVERNPQDMQWKKFLDPPRCAREAPSLRKAPRCAPCGQRGQCFGPAT